MFRKLLLPLLIAAIALSAFANVGSAAGPPPHKPKKHTPWKYFQIYSMTGATLGYTGYQYCAYARAIALDNGYDDGDTQGSFYYGEMYAYYSFIYGYYGHIYGFADWVTVGGDYAVASRNYEKGIYDYLYNGYYQDYPNQLQHMMDILDGATQYEDLAQAYYYYSVTFVQPKDEASTKK